MRKVKNSGKKIPLGKMRKWGKCLKLMDRSDLATYGIKRFFARYSLAVGFEGIKVKNLSEKTKKGYDSIFKVQIAYSAFDALLTGIEILNHSVTVEYDRLKHVIDDEPLAERFRNKNSDLLHLALMHTTKNMTKNLLNFNDSKSNNVMHIAAAVRHLSAHGLMTVNGARLDLVRNVNDMNKLGDEVIKYTEGLFGKFVDELFVNVSAE